MTRRVFVQQNSRKEWLNRDCFAVAREFSLKGYEVVPFSRLDFNSLDADSIVYGDVDLMRESMSHISYRAPDPITFPKILRRGLMDRDPILETVKGLLARYNVPEVRTHWVMPYDPTLFESFKATASEDLVSLAKLDMDTNVWIADPITFLSEYKIYVLDKGIASMVHYKGDPLVFPDKKFIKRLMIRAAKMVQASFVLNIGVAYFPDRPEPIQKPTFLVKTEETYSSSVATLNPLVYCNMIEERWNQLGKISV